MGVYPLIMVVVAGFIVEIGRRLSRWSAAGAAVWTSVVLLMLAHLGHRLHAAYPAFHLYGHDLVGDRWMGAESRGYRNLIQTPSDGVAELIAWCNESPRVREGSRVVSFLWEERIIASLLPPDPHYRFVPRGVSSDRETLPPAPSIGEADVVLLHINNLLGYGDRPPDVPPMDELRERFEVAHAARRGGMEVAWAYLRKGE